MIKLPEPASWEVENLQRVNYYTESQMRQAIRDALEEAAKVCDSLIHYGEVSGVLCAKAIRELKEDV